MNIKQVKYYVETVEQGSLSAAAKELYVTVQAISKAIVNLESELGCELLERGSRGVCPTAYGKAFYYKALRALDSFQELEAFARTYRGAAEQAADLRLGLNTPPFSGNEQMRDSVAQFIESQLGITTVVPLATGEQGFADLQAGLLDALITVGTFRHEDVVCNVVGTVAPAVMMRREHPLAGREFVSMEDLEPYAVANPGWFSVFSDTIASVYRERATGLRYVDVDIQGVVDHVHNNDGVIFTTGISALGKLNSNVALVPIVPDESVAIPICLVSMEDRTSPTLLRLQKLLLSGLTLIKRGKRLKGEG